MFGGVNEERKGGVAVKKVFLAIVLLMAPVVSVYASGIVPCPEPGSGAAGVAEFQENCVECDYGPQVTCNGEFAITLLGFDYDMMMELLTATYEVYKFPDTQDGADLMHWVLGLDLEGMQLCLAKDKTLEDLFVACSVSTVGPDIDCGLVIPDPTTQLDGMKFEGSLADGESKTFSLTFDQTALKPGFEIVEGCVVAGMKADEQDIQRSERPVPGYACIAGPVCEEEPELFICPKSQGFWKTHPNAWPVDSLALGCEIYTKEEAIYLMKAPVRGDASLILAKQLIAAKLNIENGSDPAPIEDTIEAADELLCTFTDRLPLGMRPFTNDGREMVHLAGVLDAYNNGWLTPTCVNGEW